MDNILITDDMVVETSGFVWKRLNPEQAREIYKSPHFNVYVLDVEWEEAFLLNEDSPIDYLIENNAYFALEVGNPTTHQEPC